jgi:hypothetical protein
MEGCDVLTIPHNSNISGDTTDEACGFEELAYDSFAGVSALPH